MATREPFRRTFLGEDSWLEIFQKAATMAALAFGVYAYVYSVKPVFEKESELQAQQQLVEQLRAEVGQRKNEVDQLKNERSVLQQELERTQAFSAAKDEGLVFSYLAGMRWHVEEEARSQERAGAAFEVRASSLAYANWVLEHLESPAPGSPESYQKEAAEFFQRFVARTIRPKETDVSKLGLLLDAYAREGRREAAAP
ncbi:MAG TPA: hypothetical protein VNJ70_06080 [Thermoanaerobaculia bacterium]|nr:hypothetical protein [Thermoanaerobaculia bacterium]